MFAANLARRFLGLIAGVSALVAMWTFADKPYIYEWMGRPDEAYPEIVFFLFGIPAAFASLVSGAWIVWAARPSAEASWTLTIARVISGISLAICLWLSWLALSAFFNRA